MWFVVRLRLHTAGTTSRKRGMHKFVLLSLVLIGRLRNCHSLRFWLFLNLSCSWEFLAKVLMLVLDRHDG